MDGEILEFLLRFYEMTYLILHYFIEVYMCYILEYVSWVVASARWTVCPRG